MDIYKTIVLFFICLSLVSCDKVSRQEHQELLDKYQLLQEASKATDIKVVQQYKDINTIFEKIESVSGKLIVARQNIEGTNLTQVEKINIHVESIANELKKLRDSADKSTNPELFKTIEHLQKTIIDKQKEIDLLKIELQKKEKEIEAGKQIISNQESIIEKQNREIHEQQALKWHEMGILLYNVSLSYEEGSKGFLGLNKGNYNKMKNNKKLLLIESKKCFEESVKMGIVSSMQYLAKINEELSNL